MLRLLLLVLLLSVVDTYVAAAAAAAAVAAALAFMVAVAVATAAQVSMYAKSRFSYLSLAGPLPLSRRHGSRCDASPGQASAANRMFDRFV